MIHIEVTTTVVLTNSIGRQVRCVNTAHADAPNERYVTTFARGGIQSTEHQIATALVAQFGEHPEAVGPMRAKADRRGLARSVQRDRLNAERATMPVPYQTGDYVQLNVGEHAGRRGRVYETQLSKDDFPRATIELEPPGRPDDPSEPIVVTGVRFDDMELVN